MNVQARPIEISDLWLADKLNGVPVDDTDRTVYFQLLAGQLRFRLLYALDQFEMDHPSFEQWRAEREQMQEAMPL